MKFIMDANCVLREAKLNIYTLVSFSLILAAEGRVQSQVGPR